MDSEKPSPMLQLSEEGARDILTNQIDTYQHIQRLSQQTLRIIIAVVTFSLGLYYKGDLPINIPDLPSDSAVTSFAGTNPLTPRLSIEILLVNYLAGFLLIVLAGFIFTHGLELFTRIVRRSRLGPGLGSEEQEIIVEIQMTDIPHSGITDDGSISSVSGLNYWIDRNEERIATADSMLYTGYVVLITSIIVGFSGLMVIDMASDVEMTMLAYLDVLVASPILLTVVLNPIRFTRSIIGMVLSFYKISGFCDSCKKDWEGAKKIMKEYVNHYPSSLLSPFISGLIIFISILFLLLFILWAQGLLLFI